MITMDHDDTAGAEARQMIYTALLTLCEREAAELDRAMRHRNDLLEQPAFRRKAGEMAAATRHANGAHAALVARRDAAARWLSRVVGQA